MTAFTDAIAYASAHEVPWPRDPAADPASWGVHHADPAPFNRLRGPVHPRGGVSGVVRVGGHEVAAWGEPDRADLTFSVAKTYLALLAGVALARGLLDPAERVGHRLPGIGFDGDHNGAITWTHLLEQTSEWSGTCFGMPDQVEHNRRVTHDPKPPQGRKGEARVLQAPGSYWEYNDVRINQLSLALLHLFRRPLQEVFLDTVLRPLGGGEGFAWQGYDDAWVTLDGQRLPSVPGGSHWGGGVSVGARDQARVGQLLLDGGRHAGVQLLPGGWVERMRQPCAIAPFYGWLSWLNRDGAMFPQASPESWFMVGAGGHYVWIDPAHEAVVVVRWLDPAHSTGFVERVAQALARG
ncbi:MULTISPECIES: serine hydrolase domain-containing protein [Ramlibacter]|uniref:Serine hydrolase n=1 Tax=Ramlibacter pinisoli TaxID=2682844 RepID=A0A6N8IMP9_9BURK|nr:MULTISPECIES: serine hydrolase [Ramlibacter]MBA2963104.1 serine hydrolase [Ramlibacter sp. CGMCC 1.13660]MVQ28074.1 serine hydrolase [Ramlibacter pinisoli]